MNTRTALIFLTLASTSTLVGKAENWPMWRGPQQNGISEEADLPLHWSETDNIAWRVVLPGVAPSTPIIWEDKIFLTSTDQKSERILLLCIDTSGKQRWQRSIGKGESEQKEKIFYRTRRHSHGCETWY